MVDRKSYRDRFNRWNIGGNMDFLGKVTLTSFIFGAFSVILLVLVAFYFQAEGFTAEIQIALSSVLLSIFQQAFFFWFKQKSDEETNELHKKAVELQEKLVEYQQREPEFELQITPIEEIWDAEKLCEVSPYHRRQEVLESFRQQYAERRLKAEQKIEELKLKSDPIFEVQNLIPTRTKGPSLEDYEEYLFKMEREIGSFLRDSEYPPKISLITVTNIGKLKASDVQIQIDSNGKVYKPFEAPLDVTFPHLPEFPDFPSPNPNWNIPSWHTEELIKDQRLHLSNQQARDRYNLHTRNRSSTEDQVTRRSDYVLQIETDHMSRVQGRFAYIVHPADEALCGTVVVKCAELLNPFEMTIPQESQEEQLQT